MTKTTLAYCAGVIDSDGSMSILRTAGYQRKDGSRPVYYMPRVSLTNVSRPVPDLFSSTFGGRLYYYEDVRHEKPRGWWMWCLAGVPASDAVRLIRPYLVLKQEQADLLVEMGELITKQQGGRRRWVALTEAELEARRVLAERIKALNVRRYVGALRSVKVVRTSSGRLLSGRA